MLIKYKSKKKATTAEIAIWYLVSSIFAKGLAFISTPIFTRLMTKSDFGWFNNFTSWESIIAIIVTLDFTVSITRAKYDFEGRMNEYLSSVLLASNAATIFFYVIIESFRGYFEELFSMDIFYIRMIFVYLLFSPAFDYLQVKHRIYRKYKFFVAFSVLSALIRTVVSVLLVYYLQDKLLGRVYGYIVPMALLNFVLWMYVLYKGRHISWDCIKYASIISLPLIPHALSGIVLGSSDRVMITKFCGSEQTALYSLAYQIALLSNIVWQSMNKAWAPWLYDNIYANNVKALKKNSSIYLGTFSVIVVGILLVVPEILLIMGGIQYMDAIYCMPPVILGCAFQFVYGMYVNLEIYEKKTVMISVGTMAAALINILLNIIFIPKYGYIAAAYTTLLGYFALFVFHFLIVKKIAPNLLNIYNIKFIFISIGVLCTISFGSLILYQHSIVRYIFICIYTATISIVFYNKHNQIFKILGIKSRK